MRIKAATVLWLAVAALGASSVRAENLGQLIADARTLALDAASATRQRYSDAQITEFINQGQRQALAATNCLMGSMSFSLTPGTTYYPLPSCYEQIVRVVRANYGYMTELTPAALDGRSRGWESASGSPTYYFINFSSRGLIGFSPWPAEVSDLDTVKVEYFMRANDLASNMDIPFNGIGELQDYHHTLAYFAAAIMAAIDELPNKQASYMAIYTQGIGVMATQCKARPNYLPSAGAAP